MTEKAGKTCVIDKPGSFRAARLRRAVLRLPAAELWGGADRVERTVRANLLAPERRPLPGRDEGERLSHGLHGASAEAGRQRRMLFLHRVGCDPAGRQGEYTG